ncbi:MAG: TlpA family protein disulfide reductase [Paludibacteraceae bacterium]|nr:TlpA family protein disulfide reductase [Paludibacteraceae bacterium]
MKRLLFLFSAVLCYAYSVAQLPNITLKDIDGKQVNMRQLSQSGKPMIISFFATWCKPCMRELNAINDVYEEWQEEYGVQVVAVSIDRAQDQEKVKPLVDGNGWNFMVLLDADNEFKRAMQVQNIPHVFVVDKNGTIVEQHNGYVDGEESKLVEKFKN